MDRFKFRAWDKDLNIMIGEDYENESNVIYDEWYGCPIEMSLTNPYNANKAYGLGKKWKKEDRFIIEQCTGLKDKNRILIYEGDVVKIDTPRLIIRNKNYEVYYDDENSGFATGEYNWGRFDELQEDLLDYCEVIGSIHENPDLLEK